MWSHILHSRIRLQGSWDIQSLWSVFTRVFSVRDYSRLVVSWLFRLLLLFIKVRQCWFTTECFSETGSSSSIEGAGGRQCMMSTIVILSGILGFCTSPIFDNSDGMGTDSHLWKIQLFLPIEAMVIWFRYVLDISAKRKFNCAKSGIIFANSWTISLRSKSLQPFISFSTFKGRIACAIPLSTYFFLNLLFIYFMIFVHLVSHNLFCKRHAIILNLFLDFSHFYLNLFSEFLI